MRLRHFETIRPVCPTCRTEGTDGAPLTIAHVLQESAGQITEAILHCSNSGCQREYPVIDGIPLLLADLRRFMTDNALRLLGRDDLSPMMQSLIGDCMGPGSDHDNVRQQLSSYVWEHYSDLDPASGDARERPGTMLQTLTTGLDLVTERPDGPVLEIGCGPGRASLALAERTGELVLGVDLHLPMLRVAAGVLRRHEVRYPLRRVGMVYDQRRFPARLPAAENVDFWACDAVALPFPAGSFSLAVALNVLDCVYAPRAFLEAIDGVLAPSGSAIISTPYDWSANATPLEGWLGGHSQRSPAEGSSEKILRALLTDDTRTDSIPGLTLAAEREAVPWRVRVHDRATMEYQAHLIVARRNPA